MFIKHQDRILFGTDLAFRENKAYVSRGVEPKLAAADPDNFLQTGWRWFETSERNFWHGMRVQPDFHIDAIGLPARVLRKIYFENARRVLPLSG